MSLALRMVLVAAAAGAIVGADPTPRLSVDRLPARLDREVAWRAGAAGIEYGELQLTGSGEAWRTRVVVARLDPRRVVLSLEAAFTEDALWTVGDAESAAVFAVNAGQFRGALPWGWVVTGGRQLISPGQGPLAGAVVVDRSGAVRIVPPDDVVAEQRRGEAREAFQSYPMLLENGAPPVALLRPGLGVAVDHRDTRLALGTLPDGRVVIALTRFDALGPRLGKLPFGFTSAEMARVMRALGCRDAILLDGGISGQLMVRRDGGAVQTWAGIRSVPLGLVALPR
ncbi:MAG TPA: phosphodiester glycosidase family protein [Gemmatimonadales bacterium]